MIKNRIDVYKELFSDLIFNHDQRILKFSSTEKEYCSFYNSSSVLDVSNSSILFVTGKDTIDFLQRISSNDLTKLEDFSVTTTLFLNEKGKLIDKVKILKFPENLFLIGSPDNGEKIYRWIERYAVLDDIKAKHIVGSYLYLRIMGKRTDVFFTLLFGDQLKNLDERKIYKYIGSDFQCWIIKDEVLPGHLGYEIFSDEIYSENILRYIHSNLEIFNVHFLGNDAYEIIRIEFGQPSSPNEINDVFNPYDVNLIKYVSFNKGCYIGQEAIARMDTYEKVKFSLSGFKLERDYNFEDNFIYNKDGNIVGELTSKTYSIKLKDFVAIGILSNKLKDFELDGLFVKENLELIKIQKINLPMTQL